MSPMSNSEFAEQMMLLARPAEQFEPTATYDPDGDCIEFLVKPDSFYAERIDDLVTVYYSQETGEVIGSLIKGVRRFRDKLLKIIPGFQIEIHDGKVRLVHIFRARLWIARPTPESRLVLTYEKLMEMAEESRVEAELCSV